MFASKDNPKTSEWPELDISFRVPTLNIRSLPTLPVTIDGMQMRTDSTGSLQAFLPWGQHNVSIADSLPVSEGVRMTFVRWSDGVTSATRQVSIGNNMTLSALYEPQYRLDVSSPYATTNGSGWYFQNETAVAFVEPTTVPAEGTLGLVGVRHVLDHWVGNCLADNVTCKLIMSGPSSVIAVWRDDYTTPILLAVSIAVIVSLTILLHHRRKRQ